MRIWTYCSRPLMMCSSGIESKFTEPYTPSPPKTFLKLPWVTQNWTVWTDAGLPGYQALAERLRISAHGLRGAGRRPTREARSGACNDGQSLDAMLSLVRSTGSGCRHHRAELTRFADAVGQDARHFTAITYQVVRADGAAGWFRARRVHGAPARLVHC